jgi:biotin carboxyl carrier protein
LFIFFSVVASVGDEVEKGAPILIIEAMKMEHVVRAPKAGVVESINFAKDDLVDEKVILAVVTAPSVAE